jgi:hypothetical protein
VAVLVELVELVAVVAVVLVVISQAQHQFLDLQQLRL